MPPKVPCFCTVPSVSFHAAADVMAPAFTAAGMGILCDFSASQGRLAFHDVLLLLKTETPIRCFGFATLANGLLCGSYMVHPHAYGRLQVASLPHVLPFG